ncbi:MAG: CpsD/CapB family tyrosine-protein kinase [Paracoccaceae bacterium]|jgi:Mrp family chromosome partitioning ATPase
MRDFIEGEMETAVPDQGLKSADGANIKDMTEQGFKRFRRRKNRSPETQTDAATAQTAAVEGSASIDVDEILDETLHHEIEASETDDNENDVLLLDESYDLSEQDDDVSAADRVELLNDPHSNGQGLEIEPDPYDHEPMFTREELDLPPLADDKPEEMPLPELEAPIQLPAAPLEPWEMLRPVPIGVRQHILKKSSLISFFRADPAAKRFDLLRTRLLKTLKDRGWSRVAIASPTKGCGSTFTAVNLALSLSRVPDTRTVLMDLNQRDPGVAKALDIMSTGDMPGYLAGRVPLERQLVRCGTNLAVGATSYSDLNASEILHDTVSAETLNHMQNALKPDVVIYDLPPVLEFDDAMAFFPQVDGVLLIADGAHSTAEDIAACERLIDGQTQLLGVVLNRAAR